MTYNMIDVSSNNHEGGAAIDGKKVYKAGYRYAMIKATEGTTYLNPWLARDAVALHNAGLILGYYHFYKPGDKTGKEQAEFFWHNIMGLPRSIGVSLDVEQRANYQWAHVEQDMLAFWNVIPETVKERTNYSAPDWFENLGSIATSMPQWVASPGKKPHNNVWAWQAGQQAVPGIPGVTDVGVFYG